MDEHDKLDCAIKALKAIGNTEKCIAWYEEFWPDYIKKYGLTTMQYSLSAQLAIHALEIINLSGAPSPNMGKV